MKTFIIIAVIASGVFLTSCSKKYGCFYSLNTEAPEISQPDLNGTETFMEETCRSLD